MGTKWLSNETIDRNICTHIYYQNIHCDTVKFYNILIFLFNLATLK